MISEQKSTDKKRILLIGGNRYVGARLRDMLTRNLAISALATVSRSDQKHNATIHFVCDRKNVTALLRVFSEFEPDVIIDMACFDGTDIEGIIDAFDNGYLPFLNHYIVVSTFFVYNVFKIDKYREAPLGDIDIATSPADNYTLRKIELEKRLFSSRLFNISSILRLPFVFSADDYSGRFQEMCKISVDSKQSVIESNHKFSMISKDFAAAGIKFLVTHEPVGFIDYASQGFLSSQDILEIIAETQQCTRSDASDMLAPNPYVVGDNLCSYSNKIPLAEDVVIAIKREAIKFFEIHKGQR